MKRKKLFALCMISCFALSGCGQAGGTTQEETSETTQVQEEINGDETVENETTESEEGSVQEQQVTITCQTESNSVNVQDGREIYTYEYSYPLVTIAGNEQAAQEIAMDQEKRKNEFLESSKENENSAKELYAQIAEEEQKENFQIYENYGYYNVARNDSRVISFIASTWAYLGGAHGGSYYEGVNYDRNTGKLLTLKDIFEDEAAGLEEMKSYILKQCESSYYQERLYDDYQNDIDSILTEEFWYLGKDGVHVISNEYMLGPYAAGNFEFIVPYTELNEIKEEYKPEGAYIYPVLNGSNIETDLDSDGTSENICFDVKQTSSWITDEDGEDYEVSDAPECTLTINGQDVTGKLEELAQYYLESPYGYYYVVDLDDKDEYKELAICDCGFNDYNVTYFFRYANGELSYVGSLQEIITSETCNLWGDGTLNAKEHSELLETIGLEYSYVLQNGKLQVQEQEWYPVDISNRPVEYQNHDILKEVTVYTEKSTDSEKKILTPSHGPVTFPATDNKEWVQIKAQDGTIYFMHMNSFIEIDSDGTAEDASEVFANLFLAG